MAKYTMKYEEDTYEHRTIQSEWDDCNDCSWDSVVENFIFFLRNVGFIFDEDAVRQAIGNRVFEMVLAEGEFTYVSRNNRKDSDANGEGDDGIQ